MLSVARDAKTLKSLENAVRVGRNLLAALLFLSSAFFSIGCSEEKPPPPAPPPIEPKKNVTPPPDFSGPIDPEWPPSAPVDLQIELRASRLLRDHLKANPKASARSFSPVEGATEGVFVDRGKIGDFEYLEVIVGPMRHPDDPMPLVVLFHGRGGSAKVPSEPFKSPFPLRIFIPQSPDKLGPGYTWFATWTMSGELQLLTRSISARADEMAAAIEAFRTLRPTQGKPILVGFSQGGMMSFALATRYPHRFGGAFPIAGWLPPPLLPVPKKEQKFPYIYAQHGKNDKTVPTEYGRETVRRLRALGLFVDYRELPHVGHIVTPDMEADTRRALTRILKPYAPTSAPTISAR